MQGDLLAETVDLGTVVLFDGLCNHGLRDGAEGAVGNLDNIGNVGGDGVDACECEAGFGAKEKGVDKGDIASENGGRHEEGVLANLFEKFAVDEFEIDTERDFAEGDEVEKIEQGGDGIGAAKEQDEKVETDEVGPIENIGYEVEETDADFADDFGYGDAQQNAGIDFENRLIESEEGEWEQEIEIVDNERGTFRIDMDDILLEKEEAEGEDGEADKWEQDGPTKEAVIAMIGVFEVGVEAQDGGVGAELRQATEKEGGIDEDAGETDLLLRETIGKNEEGGEETDDDTDIVGESPFDALTSDDTHNANRLRVIELIKCKSTNKIWNEKIFLNSVIFLQ